MTQLLSPVLKLEKTKGGMLNNSTRNSGSCQVKQLHVSRDTDVYLKNCVLQAEAYNLADDDDR